MSTPAVSDKNSPYFQALVNGLNHYVDYTNMARYSLDFESSTTILFLFSTTDCWVRIVLSSSSDVASVGSDSSKGDSFFVPGGISYFVGIPFVKSTYKLSVIRNASDGRLHITEGA